MPSLLSYLSKPKQQEQPKDNNELPQRLVKMLDDCCLLLEGEVPPPWQIVEFEGVAYKISKKL